MKEIILIEIISFVSFLYSIITLFFRFTSINQMILLFLWTIIVATFYAVNKNKSIIYRMSILLLLLPLLYFREAGARYFILITGILIFLYAKISVVKGDHSDYVSGFKRTFIISVIIIFFRYLSSSVEDASTIGLDTMTISLSYAAIFLIMYVLTSIALIRLMRHLEFNKDIKGIRNLNIKYLIITGLVLLTTGFEQVRNLITMGYRKIVNVLMMIIIYPMRWLTRNMEGTPVDLEVLDDGIIEEATGITQAEDLINILDESEAFDFTIIRNIAGIILCLVLIYLVYRLLIKSKTRHNKNLDYTEEREYIEKGKRKKRKVFQNIVVPSSIRDQIRFYYRKYLKKLNKSEIEIVSSDTSFEINEKASNKFGEEIEELRKIYINSRYGNKDADKDSVEKIKNLYKNL